MPDEFWEVHTEFSVYIFWLEDLLRSKHLHCGPLRVFFSLRIIGGQ